MNCSYIICSSLYLYQWVNHKDLPLNVQVNTSQIVRIRTDFSLSPIPSNLAKDISQNLYQTSRFSIARAWKQSLFFFNTSCYRVQFGRKKLSTFRRRCFWRRNKLMSYSMIIDIYYPIELNWIEYFKSSLNFLTTFSKTSNINERL